MIQKNDNAMVKLNLHIFSKKFHIRSSWYSRAILAKPIELMNETNKVSKINIDLLCVLVKVLSVIEIYLLFKKK